ncbi:MAG: ribonuclease HII [Pseudomonadota bacterium]
MSIPEPTFDIETRMAEGLKGPIAGVDEAGRGAWAGPVVAAAVILNPDCTPAGLRDSKTLSEKRRETLGQALWACARIGVGEASVEEIDQIGVGKATYLAMQRAVANLPLRPAGAIIDGLYAPILPGIETVTVVKGDSKSLSVAAASIIAKTSRDGTMRQLAEDCTAYGWERNKGYGAKAHADALDTHGITGHHRTSFAPIKKHLEAGNLERSGAFLP